MRKYRLTLEETALVKKFKKYIVPFQLISEMQFFEYIDFDVCTALLKGKLLSPELYSMVVEDPPPIDTEQLSKYALEYYHMFLKIRELAQRYSSR